jgi:Ca2+-binding RTX toxin-like protein
VAQQVHVITRAVRLLDYTPGGPDLAGQAGPIVTGDLGGTAEIHAESGDATIYGGPGNDVIFGGSGNDTIIGGYGNNWITGGTGQNCIIGTDGRCYASRVGQASGEPLYGVAPITSVSQLVSLQGGMQQALINVNDALKYAALVFPDILDPNTAAPSQTFRGKWTNNIIYGGFGTDAIHAGPGESAISGALAPVLAYTNNYDFNGNLTAAAIESDWYHPRNPGNPLGYNPTTTKFALYDAADPRRKILLTPAGLLDKTMTGLPWILDFNANEGPVNKYWSNGTSFPPSPTQGNDAIFGDVGNKWIVSGPGRDRVYAGWGNDMADIRGTLDQNGGLNDGTVANPSTESLAFGGAGIDVLIASSAGDRLIDWGGNHGATYLVPFSPFGEPTVSRTPSPGMQNFLLQLSQSDGADLTMGLRHGGTAARNGEPFGELAMVIPGDAAWRAQHGAPRDPMVHGTGSRDTLRTNAVKPIESPGTLAFIDPPAAPPAAPTSGPALPTPIAASTTSATTAVVTGTPATEATATPVRPTALPPALPIGLPAYVGIVGLHAVSLVINGAEVRRKSVALRERSTKRICLR